MLRRLFLIFITLSVVSGAFGQTIDLMDAYIMALGHDAAYQNAYALFLANREAAPQALAVLLPQLTATANYGKESEYLEDGARGTFDGYFYALNASQTLFDYSAFSQLAAARASVKQAAYQVAFAQQQLMLRVAAVYFGVLEAREVLEYSLEQRNNLRRNLDIIREQFKVKHATITDLNQAEGSYDLARTDYLTAVQNYFNRIQELNEVIGDSHGSLAKLASRFPLANPQPNNLGLWEDHVNRNNLEINAARFGIDAARSTIEVQRGGNFPTVNAVASTSVTRTANAAFVTAVAQRFENNQAGVNVNFPFFQGGLVMSRTRQAVAEYQQAVATFRNAYNINLRDLRQAYNGIVVGKVLIAAGYDAIRSNREALRNTEVGYRVGTETVLDIVQQQTFLFQAQTRLAGDKYTYLLNIIRLNLAAGTLSPGTLAAINRFLHKQEHLSVYFYNNYDKRIHTFIHNEAHAEPTVFETTPLTQTSRKIETINNKPIPSLEMHTAPVKALEAQKAQQKKPYPLLMHRPDLAPIIQQNPMKVSSYMLEMHQTGK